MQFVIGGHNHYYARAVVDGVEHITAGGGGAPLYNPDPNYPNIVICDTSHNFCKLQIDHDTLHYSAIRDDGSVIESFDYHNYHEWTGASDHDWNNASNWSKGTVPGEGWDIMIPGGLSNYPVLAGTVSCKNLHIKTGGALTVPDGSVLNVNGQLNVDGNLDVAEGGVVNQL